MAAASDFDFVALEPRRADKGAAPKRVKGQTKKGATARPSRFAMIWRYRTPAFGVALLCGLLAAIVVNAMFLQHGRHPAPLFGSTVKIVAPKPPTRPASLGVLLKDDIPQPALQPVSPAQDAAFAAPAVADASAPTPASAPAAAAIPAAAVAPHAADIAHKGAAAHKAHGAKAAHASAAHSPTTHAPAARKAADPIGALIANGGVAPAKPAHDAKTGAGHAVRHAAKPPAKPAVRQAQNAQ